MKAKSPETQPIAASGEHPSLTGSNSRTLEAVFRHPLAHNLEWRDVVALIGKIGEVEQKSNHEAAFEVSGERRLFRIPHTKDIAGSEVIELRNFLIRAGWSPEVQPLPDADADPAAPNILIVLDHHEAKLYIISGTSEDDSKHGIEPYDPHHFLHHLTHKDQSREQGQRAPEDPGFYERIAEALSGAAKIVVVGHGTGKSNAANHLIEYLRSHHPQTHRRIARELTADLSSTSSPQLIEMAHEALR
jgi:hypothetical protein